MGCVWGVYGVCVVCMGCVWGVYGVCMQRVCGVYAVCMRYVCGVYAVCMGRVWCGRRGAEGGGAGGIGRRDGEEG